jgi:hypothetical protein
MPVLKNVRYEQFAQHIATSPKTGWPQGRCYSEAGFKTNGRSADACAARLLTEANVRARIAELMAGGASRAEVSISSLLEELRAAYDGAMSSEQFSAATSAAMSRAKLAGLLVDKVEIGGAGDFDLSVEQVVERVEDELGAEAAALVLWSLEGTGEPMPLNDLARFMLKAMPLDRALERNEELRQTLIRVASDDAQLVEAVSRDDPPRDTVDRTAYALLLEPRKRPGGR